MIIRILSVVFVTSLLSACTGTTVVLIPDAGGKVGQVALTTEGGSTLLSKANEGAKASEAKQAPTQAVLFTDEKIRSMFADTLSKEPAPPERYRLYFSTGTATMTVDAHSELAKIKAVIQARQSCDLSVIGHSDRVGDNESNKGISLQRAETVAKALTNKGVDRNCMDIRYYGENDPAVPTADNIPEARNRRVEVEIR